MKLRYCTLIITLILLLELTRASINASNLLDPITFASSNGLLDLLMVAQAQSVPTLPGSPMGWIYVICPRPADGSLFCPVSSPTTNWYGGARLSLQPGDRVKIRLVNNLPPVIDSKHTNDPGMSYLSLNPTNLHTHGLLVSAHTPTALDPTYGDYIFVLTFNPANGKPSSTDAEMLKSAFAVNQEYTDYQYDIPATHPSGSFWFHPHAHGVALNQVSAGMGGALTIGNLSDYVCKGASCSGFLPKVGVHYLNLKDAQILQNGMWKDQEDPQFCLPLPNPGDPPRLGSCPGQNLGADDNYSGGTWNFTINGQKYPTIPMQESGGQIWRIVNISGSATYDLSLFDPFQGQNMLFQVLSLDGVSIRPAASATASELTSITAGKFIPQTCPGIEPNDPTYSQAMPLCTRVLHMMPSSRAEVWVTYRNSDDDARATPEPGEYAILRTNSYSTGPSGDTWPAIRLAQVTFNTAPDPNTPAALFVNGQAGTLPPPIITNQGGTLGSTNAHCATLPPGHMRRIYFGVPANNPDGFGLAYEELDANGNVIGPLATDLVPFDPNTPTVCLPLAPQNTPQIERWQLINVATEDHNFHLHQVKFRVLSPDELTGTVVPTSLAGKGIMLDNVPLPAAAGTCGSVAGESAISDWRAGLCTSNPLTVEIPFSIVGDYVYHCHILEHEDGGMMAKIRVLPAQ